MSEIYKCMEKILFRYEYSNSDYFDPLSGEEYAILTVFKDGKIDGGYRGYHPEAVPQIEAILKKYKDEIDAMPETMGIVLDGPVIHVMLSGKIIGCSQITKESEDYQSAEDPEFKYMSALANLILEISKVIEKYSNKPLFSLNQLYRDREFPKELMPCFIEIKESIFLSSRPIR